jgi:phosphatidylinositol glycan class T
MEPEITSSPQSIFKEKAKSYGGRYSSLPREIVCTENLTPWLKLLPCTHKAGLAQLLHSHRLLDGDYQSMSIDWIPKCADSSCSKVTYELVQRFSVVLDPIRSSQTANWSMSSMFSSYFEKSCPLASGTTVQLQLPQGGYELKHPAATHTEQSAFYDLAASTSIDIGVTWPQFDLNYRNPQRADVTVHRFLAGSGQERGSLVVEINNRGRERNISYVESIPWIMKPFIHTLSVRNGELVVQPGIVYEPAIDRVRPTLLELDFVLGPGLTSIRMDYESSFVKLSEHHPDANYGFEIGLCALT